MTKRDLMNVLRDVIGSAASAGKRRAAIGASWQEAR
jgi:hypothetical protein